ncbi:MAG TPA: BON domain-containing protein [Thermoguttaceae bacterium]|nr:BON domain-containing protein [Thermoguttaceae bacterium]
MRRLFIGLVVAATTVLIPALALANNQEVAERIAGNLRASGQLQGYKIGVKYQNGTAWLRGHVASEGQLARVLKTVWKTDGVERVVNGLKVAPQTASTTARVPKARLTAPNGSLTPESFSRPATVSRDRDSGRLTDMAQRLQGVVDRDVRQTSSMAPVSEEAEQPMAYPARPVYSQAPRRIAMRPAMQMQSNRPVPVAYINGGQPEMMPETEGAPMPAYAGPVPTGTAPVRYDQPCMPNNAWPSYAAYPNYAAVTYPKQYSPTAWPFIGPFYPYPQVPLGWRKVTLEWDDGWWMLDFKDSACH